jgi:hypothetical protein
VLPHNLGDLPSAELAFAKTNPAYASGLLNKKNWFYMGPGSFPSGGWVYMGIVPGGLTYHTVMNASDEAALNGKVLALSQWTGVQPTLLEVQVAPVGPFTVPGAPHGAAHTAICIPQAVSGSVPVFVAANVALNDSGPPVTFQRSASSCSGFS